MKRETGVHKKGGVITERDGERATVRTRIPAGIISTAQLRGISDIAEKYGVEKVHITTRQAIEIPHMGLDDLEGLAADLAANGTPVGSERDEVVNVIACPGTERCRFGNIDSVGLAVRIDEQVFGKEMPVKVRISISACPNSCTSPLLNEIGVIGRIEPLRIPGSCTGCGTCADFCPEGAIKIVSGVSVLDHAKCIQCGICIKSCPFNLLKSRNLHYLVTVGGRRGRHPRLGRELVKTGDADRAVEIVERTVQWIYRRAWSGRLLSDQLDDLQFDQFRKEILQDFGEEERTGT